MYTSYKSQIQNNELPYNCMEITILQEYFPQPNCWDYRANYVKQKCKIDLLYYIQHDNGSRAHTCFHPWNMKKKHLTISAFLDAEHQNSGCSPVMEFTATSKTLTMVQEIYIHTYKTCQKKSWRRRFWWNQRMQLCTQPRISTPI